MEIRAGKRTARAATLLMLVTSISASFAGCKSPPPLNRNAVFVREDVTFDDIWDATIAALTEYFHLEEADRVNRYLVTGYRYDDEASQSVRWRTRAWFTQYEGHWAVQISTTAERLRWNGWADAGVDDKTARFLTRRIDEHLIARKGPPPG